MPTPETVDKWRKVCALSDAIKTVREGRGGPKNAQRLQALVTQRQALQRLIRPVLVKG